MNSKILASIAIVFVGLAFLGVAFVVFLTRGKSAFWVNKKLKTGAALLTLSSIISGSTSCGVFQPTCYEPAIPPEQLCYDVVAQPPFEISIQEVDNTESLKISGVKTGADGSFVYSLCKENDTLSNGKLLIDSLGGFKIQVDKEIKAGEYFLLIQETQSEYTLSVNVEVKD